MFLILITDSESRRRMTVSIIPVDTSFKYLRSKTSPQCQEITTRSLVKPVYDNHLYERNFYMVHYLNIKLGV